MNELGTGTMLVGPIGPGDDGVIQTNKLAYGSVVSTATDTNAIRLDWVSLHGWAGGDVVTLTLGVYAPGSTMTQVMRVVITNSTPKEWYTVNTNQDVPSRDTVYHRSWLDFGAGVALGVLFCGLVVAMFAVNFKRAWAKFMNW